MNPFRALAVAVLAVLSIGIMSANCKNPHWPSGLVATAVAIGLAWWAIIVATS